MSAAVLATDEEWSIISSSDLEELSGNTSDAGHDSESIVSSLKHGNEKVRSHCSNTQSEGKDKSFVGSPNFPANMESTIVLRETTKVRDKSSTSQNFKSIQPHLDSARNDSFVCGYAKKCSGRVASAINNCNECLKKKSRAVFHGLTEPCLSEMKRRANSAVPRSFLESFTLDLLLVFEKYQDYLLACVLSYLALSFVIHGLLSVYADELSSAQSYFSQLYADLRHAVFRTNTKQIKSVQKSIKGVERVRVKDFYLRATSFFQPKSATVILDNTQSSWLVKFWAPFLKQEPPVQPVGKWSSINWSSIQKEFLDFYNTGGHSEIWRPRLFKLQSSANEVFQYCRSSLSKAAISASMRAQSDLLSISSHKEAFLEVLQKHLKSGNLRAQYQTWARQTALYTSAKFQEYYSRLSGYTTLEAWRSLVNTQQFGRAQRQLDAIARYSFLRVQSVVRNLCEA